MKEKHVQRRRVSQFVFTGSLRAPVARLNIIRSLINLLKHRKGAELCVNVLKTRQSDWSVSIPKQTIGWQFVCVLLSATLLKNNSLVDVTRTL